MKKLITVLSIATLFVASLGSQAAAAGSASLAMSPSSASYTVGNNFSITISENSGADTVNVVEADFTYDASKVQFVSIACNGGFEIAASATASGLTCGTVTPKSGSQVVGVATFKALAGSGSAPISFTSTSHIYRSTDNVDVWNGAMAGATIGFTTPVAPVPTPVTTPVTPTNSASTTPSTSTNQNTPTTPVASDVSQTTTTIAAGTITKSFTVVVVVVDSKGNVVKNASVVLNGKTVNTDASGKASFGSIVAGTYDIKATSNAVTKTTKVTVNAKNKATQTFMVQLPKNSSRRFGVMFGSLAGGLILGGGLAVRTKAFKAGIFKRKQEVQAAIVTGKSKPKKATAKSKTASKSQTKKKPAKKTSNNLSQLATAE